MSLVFFTYVISAVVAKPDWYEVGRSFIRPSFTTDTGYLFTVMALIGTTIAPFMQIYVQSAAVEKGMDKEELSVGRADVIIGMTLPILSRASSLCVPPLLYTYMESETSTLPPRRRNHWYPSQEFMPSIYL